MPLTVTILMGSGDSLTIQVRSAATVFDLKYAIKQSTPWSVASQRVAKGSEILEDYQSLRDSACIPERYVLEAWYKWIPLEVEVTLVLNQMVCQSCGNIKLRMRKCSRCGVRYCCQECDWRTHKSTCVAA